MSPPILVVLVVSCILPHIIMAKNYYALNCKHHMYPLTCSIYAKTHPYRSVYPRIHVPIAGDTSGSSEKNLRKI